MKTSTIVIEPCEQGFTAMVLAADENGEVTAVTEFMKAFQSEDQATNMANDYIIA